MKKVILALALILGLSVGVFAQDYSVKQGYKGFFEVGYTQGLRGYTFQIFEYNSNKIELSTTHGIQLNPYIFVGAGVGFECHISSLFCAVPLFADVRVSPLKGNLTPYIELKGGMSLGSIQGAYISPSIGCRFGLTRRVGLYVGAGYTYMNTPKRKFIYDPLGHFYNQTIDIDGFGLRIGFDF